MKNINLKFSDAVGMYSYLPNRRAGPNNQAGWKISKNLINEQVRINEQGGIFLEN